MLLRALWFNALVRKNLASPHCHDRHIVRSRFRPKLDSLEDRLTPSGSNLFAGATLLSGYGITDFDNNTTADGEVGEPSNTGNSEPIQSLWWKWTAPADNQVVVDLFGSDFDTTLGIYVANDSDNPTVDNLSEVASNDDSHITGFEYQSRLVFTPTSGTTYYISVDGFSSFSGNVQLNLNELQPPDNDNFTAARVLMGDFAGDTGTNVSATAESGEPDNYFGASAPIHSVWWTWTAPGDGTVTIDTIGSDFDTTLGVYVGTAVDQLTHLGGDDDSGGDGTSLVSIVISGGTKYSISVDGYEFNVGNITLNLFAEITNWAPTAEPGGPYQVDEGDSVTLDASASTDIDGIITAYEWDFNYDGVTFNVDAVGLQPVFDASALDGPTSRTIALRATDDQSAFDITSTTVSVDNVAPTITDVSNNGPVGEGLPVIVTVLATDPAGANDPLQYEFDFDDDGIYEVGPQASNAASHVFNIGGTYEVNVRVTDGDTGEATSFTTVEVTGSAAPTADIDGPDTGVTGQPRFFTLTATDSLADEAAGFTYVIQWGDGSPDLVINPTNNNGTGVTARHVFTTLGAFQVTVTATDQNSDTSDPVSHTITIYAMEMQDGVLAVGGTSEREDVRFVRNGGPNAVRVTYNDVQSTFDGVQQIVVYTKGGNDNVSIASNLCLPAELHGGKGNDRLAGGGASNVLLGGKGQDHLLGGARSDLLIGGADHDVLQGNGGDDILIGGTTSFGGNSAALWDIMAEWNSNANYSTRIAHLNGSLSGGQNGTTFLNSTTVFDDQEQDVLKGEAGADWFFARLSGSTPKDNVQDLASGEVVTSI